MAIQTSIVAARDVQPLDHQDEHSLEHVPVTRSGYRLRDAYDPWPLATMLSYQLVGLALAGLEIAHRAAARPQAARVAVPQTIVLLIAAGTVLGAGSVALEAVRRRFRLRAALLYPLLCAPLFLILFTKLFSGPWISNQSSASYAPWALSFVGTLSVAATIHFAEEHAYPRIIASGLGLLAVSSAVLDLSFLPGLYPAFHNATLVLAWVAGGQAGALVVMDVARSWHRERVARCGVALVLLLVASVPVAFWKSPNRTHRALWVHSPGYAAQIYDPVHVLHWLYLVRQSGTGGYADVIASWVSQQPDPGHLKRETMEVAWHNANATSPSARRIRTAAAAAPPNILMITVDALRADVARNGASFSALAARGRDFARAYAPTASTDRSLPGILSGRHTWQQHESNVIRALNESGYETAFVTDSVVREALRYRDQRWLDDPQTLIAVDAVHGRSAAGLTARALQFLRGRRSTKPLFLWVHYFDTHQWQVISRAAHDDAAPLRAQYERIWHDEDREVGALVAGAEKLLAPNRTAIVVTSDHGEYLGELNRVAHGRWVDSPVIRVPLLVVAPGLPARQIERPVGTFDVAPTIAELAQLATFPNDAVSLLREDQDVDPLRPLIMSEVHEIAVVRGAHRLVLSPAFNVLQLYDDSDPLHPRPIAPTDLPDYRTTLLEPLLGSPVAASSSPVRAD